MGLDWRVLDLSSYMEALEAFNAMNDPDAKGNSADEPDTSRLARFMKVHKGE